MAKVNKWHLFVLQSFPPYPLSSCFWFLFNSLLLYPPTAFFDLCSMWLQCILHHLQKADVITAGPLCLFKPVISWEEALSNCNTAAAKIKFHCQVWRRPQTLINGRSKQKQIFYSKYTALRGFGTDSFLQCLWEYKQTSDNKRQCITSKKPLAGKAPTDWDNEKTRIQTKPEENKNNINFHSVIMDARMNM